MTTKLFNIPFLKNWIYWLITITVIISVSWQIAPMWSESNTDDMSAKTWHITSEMSLSDIAINNKVSLDLVVRVFKTTSINHDKTINDLGLTLMKAQRMLEIGAVQAASMGPSNKIRSALKITGWLIMTGAMFYTLTHTALSRKKRMIAYAVAIIIFGVILGMEPSPMRAMRILIVSLGRFWSVPVPFIVGVLLFLTIGVALCNKFICGWCCQFGTLQDFIFRLFRDARDSKGIIPQKKIPFHISNSIRALFVLIMLTAAVLTGADILGVISPFRIFNPGTLTAFSLIFMVSLVIASIFTYRPFCTLFCPFGFAGWIVESLSLFKIRIHQPDCINCGLCERACPTQAMTGIRGKERFRQDCFSCGVCIQACPKKAVYLGLKRPASNEK